MNGGGATRSPFGDGSPSSDDLIWQALLSGSGISLDLPDPAAETDARHREPEPISEPEPMAEPEPVAEGAPVAGAIEASVGVRSRVRRLPDTFDLMGEEPAPLLVEEPGPLPAGDATSQGVEPPVPADEWATASGGPTSDPPAAVAEDEGSIDWLASFVSPARQAEDAEELLRLTGGRTENAPEVFVEAERAVELDGGHAPEEPPVPDPEPEPQPEPATPRDRAVALATRLGLAYVDLTEFAVDATVVGLIPDNMSRRHTVLPIARAGDRIMVAMADPGNVIVLDDIAAVLRAPIISVVAEPEAIATAIDRYHRVDSEVEELTSAFASGAEPEADPWSQDVGDAGTDDAPIIRFVNLIISQAITDRASDIHIEPMRDELRVRYRIDGVLTTVQRVPRSMIPGVISRLKVMAELDIGERRKPQDGRISVSHSGRTVDLRVATLPTVWGEKVVARVLDSPVASLKLADLNMLDRNMEVFSASFSKPYGMILVTGPTGSGKSTTLYTTLATISKPTVNVITVEDPVEYRMPGINQVQVNTKAGMTFAAALRSILRSDPDIILLGEIRDEETAKIAIESSLTGHLVLSTLHTNDAPSSVTRLIEMGVEPFLVGSALDSVVAQRLARRLCGKCKQETVATETELRALGIPLTGEQHVVHRPVGCPQCSQTGYRGRIALHEVMGVDDEIERLASRNAPAAEIAAHAEATGMTRLRGDGWAKVLLGHTSIEEILRVTL